jgi:hypothetical protein
MQQMHSQRCVLRLNRRATKSIEQCLRLFYYKVSRGEEVERV